MNHLLCHEHEPPPGWDRRLYSAGREAGLCQSAYWASVIRKVDQARPLFIEVIDGENAIIASLLLFHKIPWDREAKRKRVSMRDAILGRNASWLEWLDGPVFYSGEREKNLEALANILAFIDTYASRKRIRRICSLGFSRTGSYAADEEVARLHESLGYSTSPWGTLIVPLTQDESQLWKKLNPAARKSVQKARKIGVTVKCTDTFEMFREHYYDNYARFERSAGRQPNPPYVSRICWNEDREGYYRYFVAVHNDEVLATLGMYLFNGVATEITSSLSPRAFADKIPAQDLLHWEMMLEAKRNGCASFDLAGVNPSPENDREAGIRRFKEKWGGEYRLYNRFFRTPRRTSIERAAQYGFRLLKSALR